MQHHMHSPRFCTSPDSATVLSEGAWGNGIKVTLDPAASMSLWPTAGALPFRVLENTGIGIFYTKGRPLCGRDQGFAIICMKQ